MALEWNPSEVGEQSRPSPEDRKSKRVYQMGDWEEEMDTRTGAKRNGDDPSRRREETVLKSIGE